MMPLRCALAGALFFGFLGSGKAQVPAPAAPQASCDQLESLGGEVKKRFEIAQATVSKRKPVSEQCRALTQFSDVESKFVKFISQQGVWCGVPSQQIETLKANHAHTLTYQKQACAAAAQAARRPEGPSLSRALNDPIPDVNTTSTGGGTLDSLAGNPLR